MRAKLLLTMGAVGVVALGTAAGTFALFSASTPNANSQFTAGTLKLDSYRDQSDTVPGPMFYTTVAEGTVPPGAPGLNATGPWAPGDSRVRVLIVKNTGSLDAWLTSVGADLVSGSSHLAGKLRYCISTAPIVPLIPGSPNAQQPQCPSTNGPFPQYIAVGDMSTLIAADHPLDHGKIAMNAGPLPKSFYFYVSLPLDADNTYQGEDLKVNFLINAVQKKNNP